MTTKTLPLETAGTVKTVKDYQSDKVRHVSLTEAKLAVMQEVGYVMKTKPESGAGISYLYIQESELLAVLRPAMVKHGLTIRPVEVTQLASDSWNSKSGSVQHRCRLAVKFELTAATSLGTVAMNGKDYAEAKELLQSLMPITGQTSEIISTTGEGADSGDKAAGKAMTSALKYALRQAFLMESGTDPDKFASQEVTGLAGPVSKELEEAFNRFIGAIATAETKEGLEKMHNAALKRGFDDNRLAVIEETYAKTAEKLAKAKA